MKIAVTGAHGQLGRSFQKIASNYPDIQFDFLDRSLLDITEKASVEEYFKSNTPDVLINCAAYTAVDKAESDQENAYLVNEQAPRILAECCKKNNVLLVHYSSDYVYHIDTDQPLKESDKPSPKGIYAKSKYAGEQEILSVGCRALIIRTSWVYSEYGNNFVKTMIRLGTTRDQLTIVDDQIGAPTYATDLARHTIQMVDSYDKDSLEVINYSNTGRISWYGFASKIFALSRITIDAKPIPSTDYPTPAPRPLWSVMDLGKIKENYGITPRSWDTALGECLSFLID